MKGMSNVDVFAISHELRKLLRNARVDKAYQPTKDTISIRFHVPRIGRVDIVFQAGKRVHATKYPLKNPKIPPSFPMLLRKYLKGGIVQDVVQHNFDRIIELHVLKEHRYLLIIELFAQGNIILLDEDGRIVLPLKRQLWSGRRISAKEVYRYPPKKGIDPLEVEKDDLSHLFSKSKIDVIRTLARGGLGGIYAEEVLLRANIQKDKPAAELSQEELNSIYNAMYELFEPLRNFEFSPQIVSDGKEDVLPLDLKIYEGYKKKKFESFNEAADEFYSAKIREEIKKAQEDLWEAQIKKLKKRLKIQENTLNNFKKTVKNSKKKGDILYSNYQKIQNIVDTIEDARKRYSWDEVISRIKIAKKQGLAGVGIIESIDKMGNLILNIDGELIKIDLSLSIPENAEIYYNKSKKAKRKIKGAKIAIEKTKNEIDKIKKEKEIAMTQLKIPQRRIKKELKWFEKLRWFLSSDGFLVIGGRDATTNEMIVKKYMEKKDIYLHCDIHGAPSVVIKSQNKEIPETTIWEAASFAASFSSAWTKGFGSQDVYWVYPEQVSKTPEHGEFVAKGAFIIRGKRNYLRGVPLLVAVGIVDYKGERIMAGPKDAVKKHSSNYVVIKPGYTKKEILAKEILRKINRKFTLEDVIRVLPPGKCDLVDL